jgi:hypothetical protein
MNMYAYRIDDGITQASIGMTRGNVMRAEDEGRSRKPGRFDAWLERFWIRLFVPSARPTTAAL